MAYNAKPNQPDKYYQGYYKLVNENKYISDPTKIIYRSSLELKFCSFIDKNPKVVRWASEQVSIPYIGEDNKQHTYHIDFYVEILNPNNPVGIDRLLIEVKPSQEAERVIKNTPPPKPVKITPKSLKNWEYSLMEFFKNKRKWITAEKYAKNKGMFFIIVTEKTINQFYI